MLCQQLTIWGQSSELNNLLQNFQPPYSPWNCFSAILTADLDSLTFKTPGNQFLYIYVEYLQRYKQICIGLWAKRVLAW